MALDLFRIVVMCFYDCMNSACHVSIEDVNDDAKCFIGSSTNSNVV